MAHFAELDTNNVVINVLKISNDTINDLPFPESESVGIQFLQNLSGESKNWKQTSYNNNFRKNYAQIGGTYDPTNDAFISKKIYPSWTLNTETFKWEAPIPKPTGEIIGDVNVLGYGWNEEVGYWAPIISGDFTFVQSTEGIFPTDANGTIEITPV
jgi:hypothetical protein